MYISTRNLFTIPFSCDIIKEIKSSKEEYMIFNGISRVFSLKNEEQYDTIGAFWDELTAMYGLENLVGLGYRWINGQIYYAIGLKDGIIEGANFTAELPDEGWSVAHGLTDELPRIYDEIYKEGALSIELEYFTVDGRCEIKYRRDFSVK